MHYYPLKIKVNKDWELQICRPQIVMFSLVKIKHTIHCVLCKLLWASSLKNNRKTREAKEQMNSPQDEQKDEGAMFKLPTLLFLQQIM